MCMYTHIIRGDCVSLPFSQQRTSLWQTPVYKCWNLRWPGWCWHHLCIVIRSWQVWGGCGTSQWSSISCCTEVYGRAHTQPASPPHGHFAQNHRPPNQRSSGSWTCPLVSRCARLDHMYRMFPLVSFLWVWLLLLRFWFRFFICP